MSKELTKLRRSQRTMEQRVTNSNKTSIINQMNKYSKDYGFQKLSKTATVREVQQAKQVYIDRLGYDIISMAINEGNNIVTEVEGRQLKKSSDYDIKRLAEFGTELATAKKISMQKLSSNEINFLETANKNVLGYGNEDVITMFEKTKSSQAAKALIDAIKKTNPKDEYYQKHLETFRRVFQKVNIVRETDIAKVIEHLKSLDFEQLSEETNSLLKSLEVYGSPDNKVGAYGDEETELSNARLDDYLIKHQLKKGGIRKATNIMNKYKR